jgi:hypothetical protein
MINGPRRRPRSRLPRLRLADDDACKCPIVLVVGGVVPFCEWRKTFSVRSMRQAAADSDPYDWLCPWCEGPIVRTFLEYNAAGQRSSRIGELFGVARVHAGYRCWSAVCGWRTSVCWMFDATE